jgi:hypothetical protein
MSPIRDKALENLGHKFAERPGYIASATGIMIEEKPAFASALLIRGEMERRSDIK